MTPTYNANTLQSLFKSPFDLKKWYELLEHLFQATKLRTSPEKIETSTTDAEGYYLGEIDKKDGYCIGLFRYKIKEGSVLNKRVALRNLTNPFIHAKKGMFDAALVVFDTDSLWRLSFISDIKEEATSPKRYTYLFGDTKHSYHTAVKAFVALQERGATFSTIKDAFSVEPLTKQFYSDLFEWYQWAISKDSGISFPKNPDVKGGEHEEIETKIIRLITRLMFVWFIKQKHLVPDHLFDPSYLSSILKEFEPQSPSNGNYYNAILQNLFFATLNRAIEDEKKNKRGFAKTKRRDVKNLYRYPEMFSIGEEEVIELFAEIPFLNGGLFECLDKTRHMDGVEKCYNYDGFSRNAHLENGVFRHRATIPNLLFFHPEKGLISILRRYNFTIEENSPEEQEVALDPELLGKVFENLLGAYNPETHETARNQSGSFYTPREVVNYMVDESLIAYLGDTPLVRDLFSHHFNGQASGEEYQGIAAKLKAVKVFDPACGSGAFPMGLLARMVDLLLKINPAENIYDLKLHLIENSLYGSDIQCIAAQITKLRFFISLICECEKDTTQPNFGIPTLPNLETNFVSANSLIERDKKGERHKTLFHNEDIDKKKKELIQVRHQHFSAKSSSEKYTLRQKDRALRDELINLLTDNESTLQEYARQLAEWDPYNQNAVSSFFDSEWMFGVADGFDIVIGNPPYIQLQNNGGALAKLYEKCGYATFTRMGDIYCLFYERGWQLLKKNGHLCYITSNKWMRAGYGEKTRAFLAKNTNPLILIDFAGVKVFESATVDTNILLFAKSENQHKTVCAVTNKQNRESLKNLSDFVQQQNTVCDFGSSESWVVLSPIEQSIKRKIEAVGTPLKDWDINIYRGVLTGCNEAFIISTEKRDEILANCQTENERKRTEELIRPILRGRDIKRYGYEWANLWLIATFPSRHYDIEEFPAVKQHLLSFGMERLEQTGKTHTINSRNGEKIKSRKKTNNKWFETQDSINYWDDFFQPKICWNRIGARKEFALLPPDIYLLDSMHFFIGGNLDYLCSVLNSKIIQWLLSTIIGEAVGGNAANSDNIWNLPIPNAPSNNPVSDSYLYEIYQLTPEEIAFIESQI